MGSILSLAILTVICWSFVFILYSLRRQITLIPYFVYLGVCVLLAQNLADLGFAVIFDKLYLLVGSVAFFTTSMLGILILYLFEGPRAARVALKSIVAVTVFYVLVVGMVNLTVRPTGWVSFSLGYLRFYFFSILAMILDVVFMAVSWELFTKVKRLPIFVRLFLVTLGTFALDSLVFVTGSYVGQPQYGAILVGSLWVRLILAIAIIPVVSLFLRSQKFSESERAQPKGIWEILNFRSDLETRLRTTFEMIRHEQELNQELNKFKMAVQGASDHVVITDPEGTVLFANPMVEKITGFPISEIIGKKAGTAELWGGLMPKSFYEKMWHTIKMEKKPFSGEVINHRKNGQKYVAQATISPILGINGEVNFFLGIERDITKEKEVDRMKTEFVSLVTHQLKTPITATKWNLEMLMEGDYGKVGKEQMKALTQIADVNKHMDELVQGLLNISRIESGRIKIEPKPTILKNLYKQILEELKPLIEEKKIQVELKSSYDEAIKIDPILIREVEKNLLTNAVKYSGDGTTVKIEIEVSGADDNVTTRVTDQGMGIPEKEQASIFSQFYRASNAAKAVNEGTGLGLYLAKQIIDTSGGQIGFESQEGKGTSFWFSLPKSGVKAKDGEVKLS